MPLFSSLSVPTGSDRYKKLFDIGLINVYTGFASNGTASSAAAWTIKKTIMISGNPTSETWTTIGTAIWDNRATEIYS